jgi:hypothetical protein
MADRELTAQTTLRSSGALAAAVGVLLAACANWQAGPAGEMRPLSRLTVHNQNDAAEYVRATWMDGMEMTYRIPAGEPLYVSGSIAGGFPARIEVLDAECTVLETVRGTPPDTQAIVTVSAQGVAVTPITTGGEWHVADTVQECRTKPDPP